MEAQRIHDPRIEKAARAMCAADGLDPDEKTPTQLSSPGNPSLSGPRWRGYLKSAARVVAVLDVLNGEKHE